MRTIASDRLSPVPRARWRALSTSSWLASRTGSLAAGSTASYDYTAAIPEAGVSIRSQWFEVKGQAFSGAATDSYLYANIDGGPNTGSAYVEMALRDSMDVLYRIAALGRRS